MTRDVQTRGIMYMTNDYFPTPPLSIWDEVFTKSQMLITTKTIYNG